MAKVRDCMHSISAGVDIVRPNDSVEDVVNAVSRDPASRAVYVVDDDGRLLGTISVRQLLLVLGARYTGDRGSGIAREIMATCARDLMDAPISVDADDDIGVALRHAVKDELYDIPVVEGGKVVGNLDCLEIIVNCRPGT